MKSPCADCIHATVCAGQTAVSKMINALDKHNREAPREYEWYAIEPLECRRKKTEEDILKEGKKHD